MKQYSDLSKAIHKEGYIFIAVLATITFLLSTSSASMGWIGLIVTTWCVYFFRNPDRVVPISDDIVLGIGDGIIDAIKQVTAPAELGLGSAELIRVSVFLNIFNVHVNRVPSNGKITFLQYIPGKFFNASLDKSSVHNERQLVAMEMSNGKKIAFTQIAGLIARRIICDLQEEQEVKIGDRYGIIRFGSRVDLYLPLEAIIMVHEGQHCVAGETIVAQFIPNYHPTDFVQK